MAILELNQLSKSFGSASAVGPTASVGPTAAVDNVSLSLDQGQILCLLGPSGCGKTTLLRMIAGLESIEAGHINFAGENISAIPPHQRDFGLMFQEFALFPHKTVGQNVAFGLQMKHHPNVEARVQKMLLLVGLTGFAGRDVSSLSGGERQRVALARSLAPEPRLLMLDEPLGALDRALRERLMLDIRHILKSVGLTAVYVTHDQTEAFAVADRIVVMNQGHIEQNSTPEQLYYNPVTPFVAQFLGFHNLVKVTYLAPGQVQTPAGVWPVDTRIPHRQPMVAGQPVMLLIRPEAASLQAIPQSIPLEGRVENTLFRGRFYQITVSTFDHQFVFEISSTQLPDVGSKITVWLTSMAIQLLPIQSET